MAEIASRVWTPNKGPQAAFLACPIFEVLYGGAAGGGKSDALLMDALRQIGHRKYRAILFRTSYPDLEELIQRSQELYPAHGGRWNDQKKTWRFPSGALVKFRYISRDADVLHYQGHQYQWIGFDELTHFTEFQYRYLFSRCRSADPTLQCFIRASTNPGGPGHNWVHARFIAVAQPLTVVEEKFKHPVSGEERTVQRVFIPARLKDNPQLAATDYGLNLQQLNEADRRALLYGDWDAYTGSVFRLEQGVHVWSWAQFKARTGHDRPPKEWTRYRVYDRGFAKPFACYWIAVDYEGRAYVYREWYGVARDSKGAVQANVGIRMEHSVIAERMRDIEAQERRNLEADDKFRFTGWTGPDLFSAGSGETTNGVAMYAHYQKLDVRFTAWDAGKDSRKAKKSQLHEYLHYERGDNGVITEFPNLIFIGEECPHALRTIPALEYDPARGGEDVDTDMEDHAYDAIAGFCLMRPRKPRVPTKPAPRWLGSSRGGRTGMVV